jgi:hypothetical protein
MRMAIPFASGDSGSGKAVLDEEFSGAFPSAFKTAQIFTTFS